MIFNSVPKLWNYTPGPLKFLFASFSVKITSPCTRTRPRQWVIQLRSKLLYLLPKEKEGNETRHDFWLKKQTVFSCNAFERISWSLLCHLIATFGLKNVF